MKWIGFAAAAGYFWIFSETGDTWHLGIGLIWLIGASGFHWLDGSGG